MVSFLTTLNMSLYWPLNHIVFDVVNC
jgi:hypothetical protein